MCGDVNGDHDALELNQSLFEEGERMQVDPPFGDEGS